MRIALNLFLGVLLVAAVGLGWVAESDPTQRNVEFMPEMARSVPADAFSPSSIFRNGHTLQAPPAGAVARGYPPLHYTATPADGARAGIELVNPYHTGDRQAVARGAVAFGNFCRPCHGPTGRGDGSVVARGVPAPPSLVAAHAVGLRDGQIFHILTYGQANMASYASQLSRNDRWMVILHIRSLQRDSGPPGAQP